MHHRVTIGQRRSERLRRGQVAHMSFAGNAFEVSQIAGLAHQQTQLSALRGERLCNVVTDKSCCACEKDFHKRALGKVLF